jgi:hypothetical protein
MIAQYKKLFHAHLLEKSHCEYFVLVEKERITSFAMTGNIKSLGEFRRTEAIPDIVNVSAHKNLAYFPQKIKKYAKMKKKLPYKSIPSKKR